MEGTIIFNKRQTAKPAREPAPVEKKVKEEAHRDFIKQKAKQDEENMEKLEDLVQSSNKILFQCRSQVPLNPFPTDLTIAVDKVAVIEREFFMNDIIHTFPIIDIKDAVVRTSVVWSALELVIEGFKEGALTINYLTTEDAIKARRIIQGLKICKDEGINLTDLAEREIIDKVEEVGKARDDSTA